MPQTVLKERIKQTATVTKKQNHHDNRFESLMGQAAWQALKPDVQRRFAQKAKGGESIIYKGIIQEIRMSHLGWLLAQACRLIGAPLPLERQAVGMPAIVSVTEDADGNGQYWTRTYGRTHQFPQVIHSSKRFGGPTGLEEYVGAGIAMTLGVTEENGGIVFTSEGYFAHLFGMRIRLPNFLMPGKTQVRHDDLGKGYFAFTLSLRHRLFGELVYQRAIFSDTGPRFRHEKA